jgi:ubiquinone/menaquinone biosynthesis C-methylase UbiE
MYFGSMDNDKEYLNLDSPDNVGFFDELPLWSAPFGLKLFEQVRLKKNITAIDIGFGAGFPLTELAMRLGKSCTVYGIDPWEAAIVRTEEKLRHYGITNVRIIRGVAEEIPLKDGSVDLIVSNNGINNVSDLNGVLSECSRIMRANGQFVLSVNLDTSMIEFYSVMEQVLTGLAMKTEISRMREHIYVKRKPLPELISLLNNHGFTVDRIVEDQFDYQFTDGTTLLQHFFMRLAFIPSWESIVPEVSRDKVFQRIEAKLNEQAAQSGQCKLTVPFVVISCGKSETASSHA